MNWHKQTQTTRLQFSGSVTSTSVEQQAPLRTMRFRRSVVVPMVALLSVTWVSDFAQARDRNDTRTESSSLQDSAGNRAQAGDPVGACCVDGICQKSMTQAACNALCGMWMGEGTSCDISCPFTSLGVCCLADNECSEDMGIDSCECAGGTWDTDSDSCADVNCGGGPLGRCCLPGDCQNNYTQQDCEDQCGMWSQGQTCGATPCLLAQGACCVGTNCINAGNPSSCTCLGGTWHNGELCVLGGGNDCNNNGIVDVCEGGADCNNNGELDECDIADGTSEDCNGNGIPDECELDPDCSLNFEVDCNFDGILNDCEDDCQPNGTSDICELVNEAVTDCGGGGPDVGNAFFGEILHNANCRVCHGDGGSGGTAPNHRNFSRYKYQWKTSGCVFHTGGTFNFTIEQYADIEAWLSDLGGGGNGIPDECEGLADCDSDGIADECVIAACPQVDPSDELYDPSCLDCNNNLVPDGCDINDCTSEDCNANGVPDECDIAGGTSGDCNLNNIPDECDISGGTSEDCNGDQIPNECDPDCNNNSNSDICDVIDGATDCDGNFIPDECEPDCNNNGINDTCDIADGTSNDVNENGIPDECDPDCNNNGIPDDLDLAPGDTGKTFVMDYGANGLLIPDCDGPGTGSVSDTYDVDFGGACGSIESLHVSLAIEHTWSGDLVIELESPAGTTVTLLSRIGLDDTSPYCGGEECCGISASTVDVVLGDEFEDSIEDTNDPIGNFHPHAGGTSHPGSMSAFAGETDCGLWTIRVFDGSHFDDGIVQSVTLDFRAYQISEDCNENGVPDECDVTGGTSNDCNTNDIPDECEDCNGNLLADDCDIAQGTSPDCNTNAIPDECEAYRDCNGNGIFDECDIADGIDEDCNGNAIPDACDLAGMGGLYVTGLSSNNVMAYDLQTGLLVEEFVEGASGTLSGPVGVVFGPNGNLLVSGFFQERIRQFDGANGDLLEDFVEENINGPIDLEIGPNGNLFVLSLSGGDVFEFDGFTGEPLGLFAELPVSPQNDLPLAMTFGPNGNLYMAVFSPPRVVEFDGTTGDHIGDFGDTISLLGPAGIDFGPNGNMYVADAVLGSIEEYDPTGTYVGQFFIGLPPGQFAIVPIEFAPNNTLYLAHSVAGAVAAIDAVTGVLLAVLENGPLVQPIGLTIRPPSSDCNTNNVPDECEDCNENGIADECDISQGTSQDVNTNNIPDECEGVDIDVAITLLSNPSGSDSANTVPTSESEFANGQTLYAEVWATDRGVLNTGLQDVYVDLAFDAAVVQANGIQHRTSFLGNTMGTIDNGAGLVSTLGGSNIIGGPSGIEPEWRRIAIVEFGVVSCPATASFDLSTAALPITAVARGAIDPADIAYGSASADFDFGCVYNLDGIDPINAGDLGIFAGCWLLGIGEPGYDRSCDFDCTGFVDAGDLGWFAAGWLDVCDNLTESDIPPCRRCQGSGTAGDDAPLDVSIGWQVSHAPRSGGQTVVDIFVRHDDAESKGVAAVYVDLIVDPRDGAVESVAHHQPFMLFTSGNRTGINTFRVGGGNLDQGIGVLEWSHVATVTLSSNGQNLKGRVPFNVSIDDRSVSVIGEGAVWADDISMTKISGDPFRK